MGYRFFIFREQKTLAFISNVCKSGIRIWSMKYLNEYMPFRSVSLWFGISSGNIYTQYLCVNFWAFSSFNCQQYTPSKKILLVYSFAIFLNYHEFLLNPQPVHQLHISNVGSTKVHPVVYNRNRDLGSGWVADSSTQPLGLMALGLGWHVCNLGPGTTKPRTFITRVRYNRLYWTNWKGHTFWSSGITFCRLQMIMFIGPLQFLSVRISLTDRFWPIFFPNKN